MTQLTHAVQEGAGATSELVEYVMQLLTEVRCVLLLHLICQRKRVASGIVLRHEPISASFSNGSIAHRKDVFSALWLITPSRDVDASAAARSLISDNFPRNAVGASTTGKVEVTLVEGEKKKRKPPLFLNLGLRTECEMPN